MRNPKISNERPRMCPNQMTHSKVRFPHYEAQLLMFEIIMTSDTEFSERIFDFLRTRKIVKFKY